MLRVDNGGRGDITRQAAQFTNTPGMTWLVDSGVDHYSFDEVQLAGKAHLCVQPTGAGSTPISNCISIYFFLITL